jgi:photosystem II stability/assembly factor-like uncharacterized protein
MKKQILLIAVMLTFYTNVFAQCGIDVCSNKTITCGDSVQLSVEPVWMNLTSGTGQSLRSVFFTAADTGYAVGDSGIILKTINGGINWTPQISGTTLSLWSVCFPNANTGYAVGGRDNDINTGFILNTTDGGAHWSTQLSGNMYTFYSVYFTDIDTGYAVGVSNTIFKTTNGGSNWTQLTSGNPNHQFYSVFFTDATTGYIAGDSGVFKTVNGGNVWTHQTIGTNWVRSLFFTDANNGYAVGSNKTYKTINGGINWIIHNNTFDSLFSVCFTNNITGYAVGAYGEIIKTIDGGLNWIMQTSPTFYSLYGVNFPVADIGYASGSFGTILKLPRISSYSWSPATGLSNPYIANPVASPTATTTYTCTAITTNGCSSSKTVTITVDPLIISGTDAFIICGDSTTLNTTTNYTGTGTLTYSWSPATGLNNPGTANPLASPAATTTYICTVMTNTGCIATNSMLVTLVPMNAPEICIITVDTTLDRNKIVWEKTSGAIISEYYILKKDFGGLYTIIGIVPDDSLSVFVDTSSRPSVHSDFYKLSMKDICGIVSSVSDYHKTMLLSTSQGTQLGQHNLIWEAYEGFTFNYYRIYRGLSPVSLVLIDSVVSGVTQYNDLAFIMGNVYYLVEVVKPTTCIVHTGAKDQTQTYNTSVSNIDEYVFAGISDLLQNNFSLNVFPNPYSGRTNIKYSLLAGTSVRLEVYNILGEKICTLADEKQQEGEHRYFFSSSEYGLKEGVYYLKLDVDGIANVKKLISISQ